MIQPQIPFRPDGKLEKRVLDFLKTRAGAEAIDELSLTADQEAKDKADFFLKNRSVICEVKNLEADTKQKIGKIIAPILEPGQGPVFYGEWPLEKILKHVPNGQDIQREIFDAVTSAVQGLFRKANRQIRITKETFGLPKAGGLLIIVNDLVEVLSPEVLSFKISELFRKRTPEGALQFPEVEAVWIMSETHLVEVAHNLKAIPAVIVTRDGNSETSRTLGVLSREWASTHGMPYLEMSPELSGTIKFESATPTERPTNKITRQQLWEQQYRQSPYLRRHTGSEIQRYFNLVMRGLAPGFLKGSTTADQQLMRMLLERWTHLLQELKERGVDMRAFSSDMQEMGQRIKSGDTPRTTIAEIEAAGTKAATIEIGRYYTNSFGKNFRCVNVVGRTAKLVLLDQHMGKTLEAQIGVDQSKWHYYWPSIDEKLVSALDQRFLRFKSRHSSDVLF